MAKVVKDTRKVMDVEEELKKVNTSKAKKKEEKTKSKKVESTKKKNNKKTKKSKKHFTFFREVRKEVSMVKWPSKKEMVKYSFATIAFVLFFGVFFYVIDLIIALLKAGV